MHPLVAAVLVFGFVLAYLTHRKGLQTVSALSDAVSGLIDTDETLRADVDQLITVVQGIPQATADAVTAALAATDADEQTVIAAANSAKDASQAEVDKVLAALPTPAPAPTDDGSAPTT